MTSAPGQVREALVKEEMCSLLRDPWGHLGFLLLGYQSVIRVPGATGHRTEVVQAEVGNPALLRQELVCVVGQRQGWGRRAVVGP